MARTVLRAYADADGPAGLGMRPLDLAGPLRSSLDWIGLDIDRALLPVRITRDTLALMAEVSIRELRNHGGAVVDRVAGGEQVTITRDGRAVAELIPARRQPLTADVLVAHWRHLPVLDPRRFRADIDSLLDASL